MVRMKVVEVARTKTLIQLISWNRACPPIGEFKMFAIVLQLIYSDWTELLRPKAQVAILHRRAESGCDHMLLDLSIPCSDWCKILLEPRLCLLKLTAKKDLNDFKLSFISLSSHACFQDVAQRTVRKYGNQKLGLVRTKKGLRRDEKDTDSFQSYAYHI